MMTKDINVGYKPGGFHEILKDEIVTILNIVSANSCNVMSVKTGRTSIVYLNLGDYGSHIAYVFKNKKIAKLLYDGT